MSEVAVAEPDREKVAPTSFAARHGLSSWDLTALVICLLLLVLFAPPLMFGGWTLRAALLLMAAPIGLALLVARCRRRDLAAGLLAASLVWTVIVALSSGSMRSAVLGSAGRDLSAWTIVASSALWAVGRQLSDRGRIALVEVYVWGASVVGLVGAVQVLADVRTGPLALDSGRPSAFLTNPVYFGAVCASALIAATVRWSPRSWRVQTVPVVVLGVGVSLSGSRVALAAAGVALVGVLLVHRSRDRLAASVLGLGSIAAGVLLDRAVGAGRNAADRLAEGAGGGRLTAWGYGLEALGDRPIRGYGFGMFRPAVQHRFSVDFVREHAANEASSPWFDAHNVVIGVLVAVGLVGAVLFLAWVSAWLPRVSGPLAWALVPIVLHWMLQPVSVYTLPLAMLMFGAAAPGDDRIDLHLRRGAVGVLTAVGVVLGLTLFTADVLLKLAADDRNSDRAEVAALLYLRDPIVDDLVAQIHARDARLATPRTDELEWRQRVTEDEPDRPFWWSLLARRQIDAGQLDEAAVSIERALELQPNNVQTSRADAVLAVRLGDEDRLTAALEQLCALGQPECELTADELLNPSDEPPEGS
ncbi:MAG: O-antigen ligase family protein [Ilumatobacter sp.]|uniref:O-antigen ligase family protein n=1 Tax=Ilumatobacter sp. TaxID=1967498 RepID=UPI00262A6A82|nr:O-antigen ligase family protein [Ilumatobacter sp.]MDJ0768637.1 O-antigen ligase family protein [Ilumatobacter sp.]